MTRLLEASDVTAGYGAQPVIHNVSVTVDAGEVVALLGPNGAGKTTTLLALSGDLAITDGTVKLHGDATTAPLHRRARQGLSYVTEERSVFKGLTTVENLRCGGVDPDDALALFPELEARLRVPAGLLSGGEQQMLTLARALCRKPRLLLADELSLGLAPLVVERLLKAVRAAADGGTGVLLVEQHARKALRYADRVYVLRRGRIQMATTAIDAEQRIDEIEASYLAGSATDSQPGSPG
jgi:branched-chain amino acid transport system ATP-binding protein